MNISGIGIIFNRGRGIKNFDGALHQGWEPPSFIAIPSCANKTFPLYPVETQALNDGILSGKTRRADKLSKMAILAAWDALIDSRLSKEGRNLSLGLIVATAFGPHVTTFRFLDDILDYGEANVSPTLFSHSVHNAAASYIASVLDSQGPTITCSQFSFSFQQALILAQAWLQEGRCRHVLVGSVDECGTVMEYICRKKLTMAYDGKIKPFSFSAMPWAVPSEGSVFFLVSRDKNLKKYCRIKEITVNCHVIKQEDIDIAILDADGIAGDERQYRNSLPKNGFIAGYAPIFGSMMTGSSFQCAAGALMIKNQIRYACPVQENPFNVNICKITKQTEIEKIQCIRYNCRNEKAVITLQK